MRKKIVFILSYCLLLVVTYAMLSNQSIYEKTFKKIANNWSYQNGERLLVEKPFSLPTNENMIQWDGAHFNFIRENFYDTEKAGGNYILAFFPLFPAIWKATFLPPLGVIVLNILLYILGIFIFVRLFKPSDAVFLLSISIPTMAVFFIPYAEATFFLTLSIGFWGLIKDKYWIFFIGFFLQA